MKKIKLFSLLVLFLPGVISCKKDFLDEKPLDFLSSANAFKSIKNIYIGPTGARQFEVAVVFGVTLSGALDINPSVGIASIDASYERAHLVQQTIKMVFQVDHTN